MSRAALEFIAQAGMGTTFDPLIPQTTATNSMVKAVKEVMYGHVLSGTLDIALILCSQTGHVCSYSLADVRSANREAGQPSFPTEVGRLACILIPRQQFQTPSRHCRHDGQDFEVHLSRPYLFLSGKGDRQRISGQRKGYHEYSLYVQYAFVCCFPLMPFNFLCCTSQS